MRWIIVLFLLVSCDDVTVHRTPKQKFLICTKTNSSVIKRFDYCCRHHPKGCDDFLKKLKNRWEKL